MPINNSRCGAHASAPPIPVIPLAGVPVALGLGALAAGAGGGFSLYRGRLAATTADQG
ncbi:hypothetical protein ACLQ2V_14295 [Micromonospora sp. DT233]